MTGGLLQFDLGPNNNSMIRFGDLTSRPNELFFIDFGNEGLDPYDTPEKVEAEIEKKVNEFWEYFFGDYP